MRDADWIVRRAGTDPSGDGAEVAALATVPFTEVRRMWVDLELTAPVFRLYCASAGKLHGYATPWGWQEGAPDWTRRHTAWTMFLGLTTPREAERLLREGLIDQGTYDDWHDAGCVVNPLRFGPPTGRPRAAEIGALLLNPARSAEYVAAVEASRERARRAALRGAP